MDRIASVLMDMGAVVARVTALLVMALVCSLLLRRAAAGVRHQLWAGTIVAVLLVPLVGALLPSVRLAWLGRAGEAWNQPARIPAPVAPWPPPLAVPASRPFPSLSLPEERPRVEGAPLVASPSRLPLALAILWLAGGLFVGARLGRARLRARRLAEGTSPADPTLWPAPAGVEVRTGEHIDLPMTVGALRPVILVPAREGLRWPAAWRSAIVQHEAAHVRSRDPLLQVLAELACALYWFHPLVWLAARQLRTERELAADDDVLGARLPPSEYAELLITLGCLPAVPPTSGAVVPMLTPAGLKARLLGILDVKRRRGAGRLARAVLLLVGALLFVPTAGAVLVHRDGAPWFAPGVLLGCARDEKTHQPLAGAEVDVWDGMELAERVSTDRAGCFRWFREPPRTGELVAYVRRGDQAGRQTIRGGAFGSSLPVAIDTKPALSASGIIRDHQGKPLAGALVRVVWSQHWAQGPGPDAVVMSGSDGRFHFGGLLYGTYRLFFEGPTGGVATATVRLDETNVSDLAVTVPPVLPVTGYLQTAAGQPVAGARIEQTTPVPFEPGRRLRGRHVDWDLSDDDGAFRVVFIGRTLRAVGRDRSGRLLATAFGDWDRPPSALRAGAWDAGRPIAPRAITMQPAGTVRGTVHFLDGRSAAFAQIQGLVRRETSRRAGAILGDISTEASTDEEGRFLLGPLPIGEVQLRSSARVPSLFGRPPVAQMWVQVTGEDDPPVNLILEPR